MDEQQTAAGQMQPQSEGNAAQPAQAAQGPAEGSPVSLEEVEAKRNAENLARAKANGYEEPAEPSISERVSALVESVEHAMNHNAPMTSELFEEMRALLGHRPAE